MEHAARGAPSSWSLGSGGPRWRTLAWELFVGYVFAYAFLAAIAFVASLLGIAGRTGAMAYRPSGVREFPFVANGAWSLAANIFWGVAAASVCALLVWVCLRARVREPVSLAGVAAAVVLAGYVPIADVPGAGAGEWPLQFLVALVLVRWLAVGRSFPFRVPVPAIVAAAALAGAWALAAGAYGVSHPISLAAMVTDADDGGKALWRAEPPLFLYARSETPRVRHSFGLHNRGFADVRVLAIRLPLDAPFRLTGVRDAPSGAGPPGGWAASAPDRSFPLPARSRRWIALHLEARPCAPWPRGSVLSTVLVDYGLFGRRWTQRVPLIPAPALRCDGDYPRAG